MEIPTIPTRFLVISDTHNFEFGDVNSSCALRQPVPRADVVLHCGDLTQVGGLSMYKRALKMLGSIDAELILVIAGNHDLSLDGQYWQTHLYQGGEGEEDNDDDDDDPLEHSHALDIMNGPLAAEAGVTYLEEGVHPFTLSNGARLSVYASPYTPEFGDWAFSYQRNEDRFSSPDQVAQGCISTVENPIPSFPNIDIIMTHGPPKYVLDECEQGYQGCENLLRAVRRARPRLHCFGHIHEGYGAELVRWKSTPSEADNDVTSIAGSHNVAAQLVNHYPQPTDVGLAHGRETLMINAAIMTGKNNPDNAPWLVDIELPRAET